jgi:hypothetical protein
VATQDLIIIRDDPAMRLYAPLAASQTFKAGAPLTLSSGAIATCPADGTEVLDGELFGFALEAAAGPHAGSRTGVANGFGAATGDQRCVVPLQPGLRIKTRNFWATGGTTAATPAGSDINANYQLTYNSATGFGRWGVEQTSATADTDVVCHILQVLDVNGIPLDIADTTGGVWVVFVPSAVDNLLTPHG